MARIAMLLGDEFEDSEFTVPNDRLREAGHDVVLMGREAGEAVAGKRGNAEATIEMTARDAQPDDFDAIVIPGGHSPDHLRLDSDIVSFLQRFMATGKLVAAICHGPQLLIEAESVRGRTLTSWPSVRADLINAGADWVDRSVVEDQTLITSRKPDDLDDFCAALLTGLENAEEQKTIP